MHGKTDPAARKKKAAFSVDLDALTPDETRQMVQDLRTHQIELEMQNEELRLAQAELDASRARYFDFYDLAPVGYVTVNESGLIQDANLTFSRLLGVDRRALVKQPLSRFILTDDRDINYLHRKQVFSTGEQHTSELRLLRMDGTPFWGHLAAIAAEDANGDPVCRIVVSDITERKATEEALREIQRMESIRELSSGIAHDYLNLLGIMMENASLAQTQLPLHHPARVYIEKALAAMERAAELHKQMPA